MEESDQRRSAIRDSLFAAAGDDSNPANDISLDNFLSKDDAKPRRSGRDGEGSVRSARSAPALSHSRGGRRSGGRMSATPQKKKEAVKLDIAQLAEAGYIEVQDGKMRLVIDVET